MQKYYHSSSFSIGQVLDLGIRIYRRNFWQMTMIALIISLPTGVAYATSFILQGSQVIQPEVLIVIGVLDGLFLQSWNELLLSRLAQSALTHKKLIRSIKDQIVDYFSGLGASITQGIFSGLAFIGTSSVLIIGFGSNELSLAEWLTAFSALFLSSMWASMASSHLMLLINLLLLLTTIFGLYNTSTLDLAWSTMLNYGAVGFGTLIATLIGTTIFSRISLVFPSISQGKNGLVGALGRSWQLTRGKLRQSMLVTSAVALMIILINLILRPSVLFLTTAFELDPLAGWVAAGQFSIILSLPLRSAIMAAYHHHLRVYKEGYDLQLLAQEELTP